jgi:hypothetical protein
MRLRISVAPTHGVDRPAGLRLSLSLSLSGLNQFKRWSFSFSFNINLRSDVGVGAVTNDQTLSRFLLGSGASPSHLDHGSFLLARGFWVALSPRGFVGQFGRYGYGYCE